MKAYFNKIAEKLGWWRFWFATRVVMRSRDWRRTEELLLAAIHVEKILYEVQDQVETQIKDVGNEAPTAKGDLN